MEHHVQDDSSFMQTVDKVRSAEQQAERTLKEANEKAEQIAKKSKDAIAKIKTETEEAGVSLKNDMLKKGREEIEKEVDATLKKTKKDVEQLRNPKFSEKELAEFVKLMLS